MIRVNGKEHEWHEGMTISDLLKEIDDSYHYPVVRVGNEHISKPNFDKCHISDNAEVFLIPMIAGG